MFIRIALPFILLLTSYAHAASDSALKTALQNPLPPMLHSALVAPNRIAISGRTPVGVELFLAEIPLHVSSSDPAHWRKLDRIASRDDGSFETSAPATPFARWALVEQTPEGLQPRSAVCWPTSFQPEPANVPLPSPRSRKGLNGIHPDATLLPDLVELGVGHIAMNVTLGSLLDAPDKGVPYDAGFVQIRINPQGLATLDRVMAFSAAHEIQVTAILLNPRKHPLKELPHPDAKEGAFSAPNMKTAEGVRLYAAAVKYLAERYAPGGTRGRFARWIVGNEVDAAWEWTNAGEKTAHEFMDEYVRALRLVDQITRRVDPNARTYISLTHHWNGSGGGKNNPHYYKGRELLEILARHSRIEGDFPWGVAHHPYPEDLFNPKTWNDRTATDSFDSPRITFKNIEVLDRFLRQKEFMYRGEQMRLILLSEQGFNSGQNTPDELSNQARALAYAWKKIKALPGIDAFHYHRWIDHEKEGGLNLGLWTVKKGSITWPESKKPSYELFKAFDTLDEEAALTKWALETIKE